MDKKRVMALVLSTVMALSGAACSTPASKETAAAGTSSDSTVASTKDDAAVDTASGEKIFRYSIAADVATLDQQKMNESVAATIGYHIQEGLTRSISGEVHPGIAESWDVSEDGLTYTFHLRDAVWSDGKAITADDFAYGMKRIVDPEVASAFAFIAKPLLNATEITAGEKNVDELGVKVIDEKTLECTLAFPAPYFLQLLSMSQFYATREDLAEQYGSDFAGSADKNVYDGPFKLKEWKPNDRIILEKNENYWDAENVKLDGAEIIVVADENTALAMYEQGELDYVDVPTDLIPNYPDAEFYYSGACDFIKLNTGDGPLANRNFRLALNYGLNRNEFINLSTNGYWTPANRFVLGIVGGESKTWEEEHPYTAFPLDGDQAKAQEYLQTAMSELGVSAPSEIQIELLTTDMERTKKEAEVIQALLQDSLGIVINISLVPRADRLSREETGDYEMVISGILPDYPDPISFLESWETTSPYNHTNYSNPEYDALLEKAYADGNATTRFDTLFEAEKLFMEDGGLVPLQLRRNAKLVNTAVTGVTNYFCGYNINFIHADKAE